VVTALGIGGLVSFAVASRKKQIGTRRALGASRGDIIRYFIGENLLIATLALGLGACLALLLNHYLMQNYALERLQPSFIFGTILLVLAISQLATLLPALKAASVSPAIATRTV
ncbi:MAG: FtsX-like permease family protein, partial [Cellvibrionaceae bacterium]|nr:FtsX-like permease family protein [Cellvibrionaceae bacterium]